MKKSLIYLVFFTFLSFSAVAKSGNDTQFLKPGHWIYDAMYQVCSEDKKSSFIDCQPLSIGELKFYLREVDYENLSDNGQNLYDKILSYFQSSSETKDFFPESDLRLFMNLKLNPEFYYKSNQNIDWSIFRYFNDYAVSTPLYIGFSNYFTIEADFFVGKNYSGIHNPNNFVNVPTSGDTFEFQLPRYGYGAAGITFDGWGVNFHGGKEGLTIGNTKLGSIIYNNTFETDYYCQLNLFTSWFKYSMDVAQVDNTKYLYLHQLNLRPLKCLKFGVVEGSLLNSDFELRYLNPGTIMHSFGSWTQYENELTKQEYHYYTEGRFCAYMCFTAEYMPFTDFRIYGYYAQNEILDLGGSRSDFALSCPDSLGGQLGVEYNFHLPDNAYLTTNLEAIYTSPYLYVKQSPEWSLYRSRQDMQSGEVLNTWIGSPFGPDCFGAQLSATYDTHNKLKVSFAYLFKLHGENTVENLFDSEKNLINVGTSENPVYIWTHYPQTQYILAEENEDEEGMLAAKNKGRYMWMSGNLEYTNQFAVKAQYSILENLIVHGKTVYTFVLNNGNCKGAFEQGVELSVAVEYKLLK